MWNKMRRTQTEQSTSNERVIISMTTKKCYAGKEGNGQQEKNDSVWKVAENTGLSFQTNCCLSLSRWHNTTTLWTYYEIRMYRVFLICLLQLGCTNVSNLNLVQGPHIRSFPEFVHNKQIHYLWPYTVFHPSQDQNRCSDSGLGLDETQNIHSLARKAQTIE